MTTTDVTHEIVLYQREINQGWSTKTLISVSKMLLLSGYHREEKEFVGKTCLILFFMLSSVYRVFVIIVTKRVLLMIYNHHIKHLFYSAHGNIYSDATRAIRSCSSCSVFCWSTDSILAEYQVKSGHIWLSTK